MQMTSLVQLEGITEGMVLVVLTMCQPDNYCACINALFLSCMVKVCYNTVKLGGFSMALSQR